MKWLTSYQCINTEGCIQKMNQKGANKLRFWRGNEILTHSVEILVVSRNMLIPNIVKIPVLKEVGVSTHFPSFNSGIR